MSELRTASRKTRVGKVVSDKMDKTIVVAVEDRVAHLSIKRQLREHISLRHMTKRTSAASATE